MREPDRDERRRALTGLLVILALIVVVLLLENRDPTAIGTGIIGFVGGFYFRR